MHKLDILNSKILEGQVLDRWLSYIRFRRKTIVFTNGCFDIIHRGHVEYLAKAADMGDVLIVGLNTDASVKRLKGTQRPLQDEITRACVLASMFYVHAVILFDEDTPYNLISGIQPDILVKGGDYQPHEIAGYDIVMAKGGQVTTIPLTEGFSSTGIINRITGY